MAPSETLRDSGFCCTFCWLFTPVQRDKGQTNRTGCLWMLKPQNDFSKGLPPAFFQHENISTSNLPSNICEAMLSHIVSSHRNGHTHPSVEARVPLVKHLRDALLFSLKIHTSTITKGLTLREFKFFCYKMHEKENPKLFTQSERRF